MFSSVLRLMVCLAVVVGLPVPVSGKIVLIAVGSKSGDSFDGSGLTEKLSDGTPHHRLGGIGSGIAYSGYGNAYVMIADRGPRDGATAYKCRFHIVDILIRPAQREVDAAVRPNGTILLTVKEEENYLGLASALNAGGAKRLDPEGVALSRQGRVFIADEYGPFLLEFDDAGAQQRAFKVPDKFLVAKPAADPKAELPPASTSGRQPNRGFEGLSITPDSKKLYAIMQSCLIQDGKFDAAKGYVVGTNLRILEVDIEKGTTRELVYTLDSPDHGVSEIRAVNDHEFLVAERDSKAGAEAKVKKLFLIDISGATDVSATAALPAEGLPPGVAAVKKQLFLDLLDPSFGLAGAAFPEKIEGMTFGPDLPDGRHLLLVTSDNDFAPETPTRIFAFAIDKEDLPGLQPQAFDEESPFAIPRAVSSGGAPTMSGPPPGMMDPNMGPPRYAEPSYWWVWVMVGGGVVIVAVIVAFVLSQRKART
jgi:hypothetical protein